MEILRHFFIGHPQNAFLFLGLGIFDIIFFRAIFSRQATRMEENSSSALTSDANRLRSRAKAARMMSNVHVVLGVALTLLGIYGLIIK